MISSLSYQSIYFYHYDHFHYHNDIFQSFSLIVLFFILRKANVVICYSLYIKAFINVIYTKYIEFMEYL